MYLIKIGILTAALVSSFSVSATRYEVACIGGGPDYFGKYQLDTGQNTLQSGHVRLNMMPVSGKAKFFTADHELTQATQ
ncbi:hypothetical protein LA59_17600 [Vibrio harveyi]|uniref:hypothetical protein n=1 Tax=Vibrio harveyi TaxID=669 RepID=UPI0005395A50|nr:hypothetical protein [Vibrio harveyi]AIV07275.1 hypothetical protein LA59_17600 [Vibrio harveyi]